MRLSVLIAASLTGALLNVAHPEPSPEASVAANAETSPLKDVLADILRSQGFDLLGVGDYIVLDRRQVLASADLFPQKDSTWLLVDLESRRASAPLVGGSGMVVGTLRDLGGNVWSLLRSTIEKPGYNVEQYAALLPVRSRNGDLQFRAIILASFDQGESNDNLCLYFDSGATVAMEGEVSVKHNARANTDSIVVATRHLDCSTLVLHEAEATYLPAGLGFQVTAQPGMEVLTLIPEWKTPK